MTGFESNLLAGLLILVVDLAVTFGIINWVIERNTKRQWEPARRRLLGRLKSICESGIVAWDRNTGSPITQSIHSGILVTPDIIGELADRLQAELDEFGDTSKPDELYPIRAPSYWRAEIHGLSTIAGKLSRAIDRVQVTLQSDSHLVAPISDLEDWIFDLPGLNQHLSYLESQGLGASPDIPENYYRQQLMLGCVVVVNILRSILSIRRQLTKIPGMGQ